MNDLDIKTREEMIKHFSPKGLGIEVGVYLGEFSKFILQNCPNLNLILLDCWQEQPLEIYTDSLNNSNVVNMNRIVKTMHNILDNYNRARIIKGFSEEFSNIFINEIFDFIYIDGNHSYEAVKSDLNNWYPKLKKGGLFCGHDYVDGLHGNGAIPFGVKSAVDEFGVKNNIKVNSTNESWPTWFFIK